MTPTYRPATDADAAAASRIITVALNDLAARQGRPAFEGADDHATAVLRHVCETDGERFWMAVDGDRPVGFGSCWVRGMLGYCGGLFVLPEWQGGGVGRRLFELAMDGLPRAGGVAALTSSAGNPVSNGLYARHGVYPQFALLSMTGPVAQPLKPSLGSLTAEPLALSHLDELRAIDDGVLGIDRSLDHRWHLTVAGHPGWLFTRRGRTAGYAYLGGDGTEGEDALGPIATLRSQDQAAVLGFALARLAAAGVEQTVALVPGPNLTAQSVLWQMGFSFSGATGLICASRPFGHLDRYLLAGDCLM